MPVAWHIVKKRHQKDALTGEGARLFGGRWNTPGQAILYAAGTLSGALLEVLVHSNRRLLSYYVVYRLSQREFAERYGFPVATVRNWEQGRRRPEGAARILLKLISSKPGWVDRILHEEQAAGSR